MFLNPIFYVLKYVFVHLKFVMPVEEISVATNTVLWCTLNLFPLTVIEIIFSTVKLKIRRTKIQYLK